MSPALPSAPASSEIQTLVDIPGLLVCGWRHVLLSHMYGVPTVAGMQQFLKAELAYMDRVGGKLLVISTLDPRTGMKAEDGVRKQGKHMQDVTSDRLMGIGQLILGSGFFASIVRSIISGINLLSPPPMPYGVFSTTREACAWGSEVSAQHGVRLTTAELEGIVDAVIARHPV